MNIQYLWLRFLRLAYLKVTFHIFICLRFFLFFNRIFFVFYLKFISQILLYKSLFWSLFLIENKENNIVKKKYIQKGYKQKNFGIYIRSFLKTKDIFVSKQNSCYLLIRFKRKNLFLTLLNTAGNVLCKTNIGSCGFKKKVKFTGYAIKRTTKKFYKKIATSLLRTLYLRRKFFDRKRTKINDLILLKKKYQNKNNNMFINSPKKHNSKRLKISKNKKKISIKNLKSLNLFYNKKLVRNSLVNKKIFKKFDDYRNYTNRLKLFKNSLKIIFRIKSSLKFWGLRFVMYGFKRRFRWFNGIEISLPIPHSKGLRLKKKRRI